MKRILVFLNHRLIKIIFLLLILYLVQPYRPFDLYAAQIRTDCQETCRKGKHYECSNQDADCTYKCKDDLRPEPPSKAVSSIGCECESLILEGETEAGSTLVFTAIGKVKDPTNNKRKITSMEYSLSKDGSQVQSSGEISASGPTSGVDQTTGQPVDLYQSTWSYTPASAGNYHLEVSNVCKREMSFFPFRQKIFAANGQSSSPENGGIFSRIFSFFGRFNRRKEADPETIPITSVPTVYIPRESKSLKLQDFTPGKSGCGSLDFVVL